jgi:LmbE family N-acetylglucosaminyl deacetylase
MFDPTRIYHLRGVPDEQIAVTVDCSTVADRVVAGLLEHRSQLHVMGDAFPPDVSRWTRSVSREHAVLAWPPREVSEPVLGDVFEGLD